MAAADYYSVVQNLYIAYFGRPADPLGLANFSASLNAAGAPTTVAGLLTAYSTNASVKALVDSFGTSAESKALYGDEGSSNLEFVNHIFNNVLNRDGQVAGLTFWTNALTSGAMTRGNAALAIMAGALANTTAQGMIDAQVVAKKVAVAANFTAALDTATELLSYAGATAAETARSMLRLVNDSTDATAFQTTVDSTITTLVNGYAHNPGKTFTLTTGVDSGASFMGGSGDDVFNGTGGTTTLTALDSLDGGAGSDTLNYIQTASINVPASVSIKNIETVVMTGGADVTVDAANWTGLTAMTVTGIGGIDVTVDGANVTTSDSNAGASSTSVTGAANATIDLAKVTTAGVTVAAATGAVAVTSTNTTAGGAMGGVTIGGGTTVSVTQNVKANAAATTAGAVAVTSGGALTSVTSTVNKGTGATLTYNTVAVTGVSDADSDDTITSISATGYTTLTTSHTNKLATLNLATGSGNITIDNGDVGATTAAKTLALGLNGVTGGTLDDDDVYTTINVTTSGAASTLANITDTALATLTVAGDKALTLTSIAGATGLTSVDASASTGGVTINSQLAVGTAFSGGSAADSIILGATTKAIATGGGDDVVTLAAGVTALGSGGSIDAGAGTGDVLSFADADDATTASGGTTFAGTISNFEIVRLAGAAGAGVTVNSANLDDISKLEVAVDLGQTLAFSNVASGGTVTYQAAQTAASTITVKNAATGTDDSFNVAISSAAARNVNALTISNVETVNFLTDDTAATSTGIEHTASLTAAAATKITVAGDAGLTLTFTGTALTTFDASGVTDGDVTWTAGALAGAATVKGGATSDANVIVLSAALGNITYTGGSGTDTITMNHATNHDGTTNTFTLGNGTNTLTAGNNDGTNTVTGGTGVDTITLGNGSNTISTGAGNDVITVGTGANTIDAGDGNDTITIGASAGTNNVNVGAGTDAIIFTGVQTAAGYYTSITGMGAGDTLDFSATANDGGGLSAAVLGAKITLGGASSFANYLDAAAAGNGSTDSAFKWFQFNGNTYLVLDNSAAATFQDGGDQVVELVGLVNLATSTQDGSYVVTLV